MKNVVIGIGLIFAVTPVMVNAGNSYIGGSFGQAEWEMSSSDKESISGLAGSVDETDTGYKVFGGYRFNEYFAAEVSYADLGEMSISFPGAFATSVSDISFEATSFSATVLGIYPIQNFDIFAKAGFNYWDVDIKSNIDSDSDDGTDPVYGVGIAYNFHSLSVRAEYERFDLDDVDVDMMSVGVSYNF